MSDISFYYHPLSPIARRVWWALLEKQLSFREIIIDPRQKQQFEPDFLALNPFHHVPVLEDGDIRLIESIAILDYLDGRYPEPHFSPNRPADLAAMRMVQMVTVNEVMPHIGKLLARDEGSTTLEPDHPLAIGLAFLNRQLGDRPYFGGEEINLADFVVGSTVPLMARLGVVLDPYPALASWRETLKQRQAWQATEPSEADFVVWQDWVRRWIQVSLKKRDR